MLKTNFHPKGSNAKILLSSVFGPYARDDEYGSRAINPMELYHNQVTRMQGAFSPRRFHHSWGILMIQENISASCTVLDFPTRKKFVRELKSHQYDVVGISGIIVNIYKVREMCRVVREVSPGSEIVVGGHVAAVPGIEYIIDADHIVKGDGIAWMREYLGEDTNASIRHPLFSSGFYMRVMGIRIPDGIDRTATIIASLGCPMGCNFCTTSAFFGGKGKVFNILSTGEDLFRVMEEAESLYNVKSFSIMDENFLLQKTRVMELLKYMKEKQKSWAFHVFSSANAINQYTYEELIELGISTIWLGLESPRASYSKLDEADTIEMAHELQKHGILVLGSTIIGLEHQTPENIREEINHAIAHETDFHQFMLYTPLPGTPLYREMEKQGKMLDVDYADVHGQGNFNFEHEAISHEESKNILDWAFKYDFEKNGPSLFRMCRTAFEGWKRYKNHSDPRIRERFQRKTMLFRLIYAGMLWAMEHRLKNSNNSMSPQIRSLRQRLEKEFGIITVFGARLLGPLLYWTSKREEKKLNRGKTYEPKTIISRRRMSRNGNGVVVP